MDRQYDPRGNPGGIGHGVPQVSSRPHERERSRSRTRGDRGGGREYSGGGGGGRRPTEEVVKTNYFRILATNAVEKGEWIQYHVEIRDAVRRKKKGPDGNYLEPREFEVVPRLVRRKDDNGEVVELERTVNLDRGTTPLSRRILMKLQRNLFGEKPQRCIVTDGDKQAYAPRRLFTKPNPLQEAEEVDIQEGTGATVGIYGPADTGEAHNRPQARLTGPYEDFEVRVTKECDENEEDADRVRMAWYIVRLREVGTIEFRLVNQSLMPLVDEAGQRHSMSQCLEIVLKNQMLLTMISCGRSPRMFYFPEDIQFKIRGRELAQATKASPNPFIGISQAIRFCGNGIAYVARDIGTDWFNLEKRKHPPPGPIPILDTNAMTIAGVKTTRLNEEIKDREIRERIQEALDLLVFHVRFTRADFDEERKKRFREDLKWSDKDIARKLIISRRNQRLNKWEKDKAPVIWTADDADLYSFEVHDRRRGNGDENAAPPPVRHTVYSYFLSQYGVKLKYPKMPIVLTKNYGYYPVEFLFQAFGKVKGANSPDQCRRVLGFHDEFSGGKKIDHLVRSIKEMDGLMQRWVQDVQHQTGQNLEVLASQFNFQIDNKPVTVKATVLPQPSLVFRRGMASVDNGSWNLANAEFIRPADFTSFAVLDLVGNFHSILKDLLVRAKRHGINFFGEQNISSPPTEGNDYSEMIQELVVVEGNSPDQVSSGMHKAIQNAQEFFLSDKSHYFRKRHIMFKTLKVNPGGQTTECLVYRLDVEPDTLGIIYPENIMYETHVVRNPTDGKEEEARMVVIIEYGRGDRCTVDPFDFCWSSERSCNEAKINGRWVNVTFVGYEWKLRSGHVVREALCVQRSVSCPSWQVECPSILFVNLPNKESGPYHLVKLLSNFKYGVQSQCISKESWEKNRNPDQYFSNIALKLNTKLANKMNHACAWEINYGNMQGIPWISEVPTLIMGLSTSRGMGKDGKTVVAASATLPASASLEAHSSMQMVQVLKIQSRSDVVEDHIMRSITKTLTIQFYKHTGTLPERVLFFRDGSSEGNFEALMEHEFVSIRQGLYEVGQLVNEGATCSNRSCPRPCVLCTPKITFTVCLNQHNVRIVPSETSAGRKGNVWSGTCVDQDIMPFPCSQEFENYSVVPDGIELRVFENTNEACNDFLLTAQGGLKGTSKPVFYRVIMNENLRFKPDTNSAATPLTRTTTQKIVYAMSFQYGTATKAVRKLPVVLYSKRLAETASGYMHYLIGSQGIEGVAPLVQIDDDHSGQPTEEKSWVRKENAEVNEGTVCDNAVRNELLPGFSPYETRFRGNPTLRTPFRTHLSA